MGVQENQALMKRYFAGDHADVSMLAEDAVFTDMSTGIESRGREAVQQMLHYVYHVAFEATADTRALNVGEEHAVWEGTFRGRHTGEFAGVAATGQAVSVPITVVYDLQDGEIQAARIYFLAAVMMQQVGAGA